MKLQSTHTLTKLLTLLHPIIVCSIYISINGTSFSNKWVNIPSLICKNMCTIVAWFLFFKGPSGPNGAPGPRGEDGNPGPRVSGPYN